MLLMTLLVEDITIVASADEPNVPWQVICQDNLTGKRWKTPATNVELGAVAALALGFGEDLPNDPQTIEKLYAIAERWLERCPPECRPIP